MASKSKKYDNRNEIETINNEMLRDKIYLIRGKQVMLDYDLAKIYGYTTSAFNRQVKNNLAKFEGEDFMFQLTKRDIEELSICKNYTSISHNVISMQTKGVKGGRAKMPYVFTEQGVYMLMTVLRGELAVRQSRALIMTFKAMKDYILESQDTILYRELLKMMSVATDNANTIMEL